MGLTSAEIRTGLDAIAAREPRWAEALAQHGYPAERIRPTGYRTLLRTIVGQQVSVASADSVWRKLTGQLGEDVLPADLLAASFDDLRACGLSRQKQSYARSLCELVESGALDPDSLPSDDEEATATVRELTEEIEGLRALDGGALANSAEVESITPLLINLAMNNDGMHDLGVRFQ